VAEETLQQKYRKVPDRAALKILTNGLEIIRCKKHEPIDLSGLSEQMIIKLTSKKWGSKFAPEWDLAKYVSWIESKVAELGWTPTTGAASDRTKLPEPIGISRGVAVHTISMVIAGRYVHAYPDEDNDE
jgi:hypothetical protein